MNDRRAPNAQSPEKVSSSATTHLSIPPFAEPSDAETNTSNPYKKAAHPFLCRLKETEAFSVTTPSALNTAGFASMAMGLLTFFRPTPALIFLLVVHLDRPDLVATINKQVIVCVTFLWGGTVIFVLFVMGFVLTFSVLIRRRLVLLFHPWALMLLYLDVFVWLSLTLYLHLTIQCFEPLNKTTFSQVEFPIIYFTFIYIDIFCFFALHYIYATFFITAELTIIEKCY